MLLEPLRLKVYQTALRMLEDGIAHGAQGNISVRHPQTGFIAITPSAIPYKEMKVEDICVIDLEGRVIDGLWKPTSETPMHTYFYRNRPDVRAIVHSHAPYSTLFGVINRPLNMIMIEAAACIGGDVPIAPYARSGSEELARTALAAMGSGVSVILANHGLLTVGPDLDMAYDSTMAVETTARITWMALSMGAQPESVPPAEVSLIRDYYLNKYRPTSV